MNDVAGTISDQRLLAALTAELHAGRPAALASLLATRGSMPRHEGARMLGLADGTWVGTVGGGNIELIAQRRSTELLAAASFAGEKPAPATAPEASLEWMTHKKNAMACGGDALLAVRLVMPSELPVIAQLEELLVSGGVGWLEEDWSDSQSPSCRLLGEKDAPAAGACDVPTWDEGAHRYVEPVGAEPVCHVFGGGHVGQALVPVLASVGFRVDVMDDRPGICDPALFPQAEAVTCGAFEDLDSLVHVSSRDYVVVLTHGHKGDAAVLERVLPHRPAYVGCIGSRKKAGFVRQALADAGIPKELAATVHLPIGEDILAVTPAEIAVSIAAQLIRCRAELRPSRPHA